MKIEFHRKKVYEDLFDEHLFRHCAIELSDAFTRVLESHGYSDKVADLIQAMYSVIRPDLDVMDDGERKKFVYDDMSIFKGMDVFFTGFKFTLYVNYDSRNSTNESHGQYDEHSEMSYDNGNVLFVPNIVAFAKGNDDLGILRVLGKTIGHEFMHAYNDYEIFVNSGGTERLDTTFLKGYSNIAQGSENVIERCVDQIIYFTDRSERNAHISQMRQELENYDEPMFTATTFVDAIKSTETFKKLTQAIENLSTIENIAKNDTSGADRKRVIKVVNALTDKKFLRFRQAFSFLKDRVIRAKLKFDEQAPKIAYDVYKEKKDKFGRF